MTLREFVSQLTEGRRGEVTLSEGITLTAAAFQGLVPEILADALESVLPGDAEIHSGWQTQKLGDREGTRHEWVLIVGDALALVRAAPRTGQEQNRFDVVVRELPLATVLPDMRLLYYSEAFRGGGSNLLEAKVIFGVAGETFTVVMEGREERPAFRHFVGHLRAAIARARAGTSGAPDGPTR